MGKQAPERLNPSGFFNEARYDGAAAGPYANHLHLGPDR